MGDYLVWWHWRSGRLALLRVLSRTEAERIAKKHGGGYCTWKEYQLRGAEVVTK